MSGIKPWVVGGEAVYVVGLEGTITAISDGTITIGGHTLPTRLDSEAGVRYLSMTWPEEGPCCRDHCDDHHSEEDPQAERLDDLVRMVVIEHERHNGPLRFCAHAMCRIASQHIEEATA